MSANQPVIIIGGGHNGLTAAAYLAQAGKRVVLCESRSKLGGIAATEEFHPGYYNTGLWHRSGRVRPSVVEDLDLPAHGFSFEKHDAPTYIPQANGPGLALYRDPEQARAELSAHSVEDAERYRAWREKLAGLRSSIYKLLDGTENVLAPRRLFGSLKRTFPLTLFGAPQTTELARVLPMSAANWLNEYFETEILKSALALPGLLGNWCGPRSSGTAAMTLITESTTGHEVKAGPAALIGCLERAARHHGADLRIEAPVTRIEIERGNVTAVQLESGESIAANTVLVACDPKHALLELIEHGTLGDDLKRDIECRRTRGTTAKVHLALDALPCPAGRPDTPFERIQTGQTLDEVQRAFEPVKSGRLTSEPQLDIRFPSISDPVLAPPGKHVASILVHFIPYEHELGWGPDQRDELERVVLRKLDAVLPNIERLIVGSETLTPLDLEARYGLAGGHVFHGEPALEQSLTERPTRGGSPYLSPIKGLFLSGSRSPLGGGITCASGALAARAILRSS